MTVLILKHFNLIREVILKTDFLNYVNDEVLSQYDDEDILHLMIFYSKNMILAKCNYEIYDKKIANHYLLLEALMFWIKMYKHFDQDLHQLSEFKVLHDHQRTDLTTD